MKIKSVLLLMLALCLTICLCACGGGSDSKGSSKDTKPANNTPASNNVDPSQPSTPSSEPATITTQAPQSKYQVKVVDEAGNPIAGIYVQWCLGDSCKPSYPSDENGIAVPLFDIPEENYKVSVMETSLAGTNYTIDKNEFYYAEGSYEMTIVLKTIA